MRKFPWKGILTGIKRCILMFCSTGKLLIHETNIWKNFIMFAKCISSLGRDYLCWGWPPVWQDAVEYQYLTNSEYFPLASTTFRVTRYLLAGLVTDFSDFWLPVTTVKGTSSHSDSCVTPLHPDKRCSDVIQIVPVHLRPWGPSAHTLKIFLNI